MITAPDIQVLEDTTNNVPVTRELLLRIGFVRYNSTYDFSNHAKFRKGDIILTEYEAKTNVAVVKPYEKCYSCSIYFFSREISYCIYTIKQLYLFLDCHDKIGQIKKQAENEVNKIADALTSTLLQK